MSKAFQKLNSVLNATYYSIVLILMNVVLESLFVWKLV